MTNTIYSEFNYHSMWQNHFTGIIVVKLGEVSLVKLTAVNKKKKHVKSSASTLLRTRVFKESTPMHQQKKVNTFFTLTYPVVLWEMIRVRQPSKGKIWK